MSKRTVFLCSLLLALHTSADGKERKPVYKPLTGKEFVEILASHDFYKTAQPPTTFFDGYTLFKGVTDHGAKTIWVNRMLTDDQRMLTIFHEFRHAWYEREGLSQREDWIRDYACKDFEHTLGRSCPDNSASLNEQIRFEYR